MPRGGATFDENDGRIRTPSSSPPYTLLRFARGERFVPLGKGDAAFCAVGGARKTSP
jgi:hypothetical protein